MVAVPMSARVRCKNKGCVAKVPLTDEHVRQLSGALRVRVACPVCHTEFVTSLIPEVKSRPDPKPEGESKPVSIPVPVSDGVNQAPPPFRPLPPVADVTPKPFPAVSVPTDVPFPIVSAPAADYPFQPIQPGTVVTPSTPTGGLFGRWNRMPKRKQNLVLVVGLVLAGGFAVGVKFRDRIIPAKPAEQRPTEPQPATLPSEPVEPVQVETKPKPAPATDQPNNPFNPTRR